MYVEPSKHCRCLHLLARHGSFIRVRPIGQHSETLRLVMATSLSGSGLSLSLMKAIVCASVRIGRFVSFWMRVSGCTVFTSCTVAAYLELWWGWNYRTNETNNNNTHTQELNFTRRPLQTRVKDYFKLKPCMLNLNNLLLQLNWIVK